MTNCCLIVTNPVQGVQGVQGQKSTTLHSCKPRRAWLCALLCRVCRVALRARVRETYKTTLPINKNASRVYMYPAHPAHPAHATNDVAYSCAGYKRAPCTPCTLYFFIKKIMKKIICGKENVEEFRSELKAAAPEFYSLVKELYQAGLISGLRGATLEHGPFPELPTIQPPENQKNAATCEICGNWQRDTVGDGTGVGQCLENVRPDLLKWPNREACSIFEALA